MESPNLPDIRQRVSSALLAWAPLWRQDTEFAVDQLGFYMEDLIEEVKCENDDYEELEEDNEESSEIIRNFSYKFQGEEDDEEKERAQSKTIAFLQMIETVLRSVSPAGGPQPGVYLPKVGLWLEMVESVATRSLGWRWSEDLAITSLHCLLPAWSHLVAGGSCPRDRLTARENLVVGFFCFLSTSAGSMSTSSRLSLLNCVPSLLSVSPSNLQRLVQALLGQSGLLFVPHSHHQLQKAGVKVCHRLLKSKNVMVLQEAYGLLLAKLEQAMVELADTRQQPAETGAQD